MALISSYVGWSGRSALNLAAMMTRRSLAAMSAVEGSVLAVYQGAVRRRPAMSAGSWPAVAYQSMARVWQASWKGMVRRTAPAVRLRACPAPKTCAAVAFRSVVTRARSYPVSDLSRMRMTWTRQAPKTEYHRQVTAAAEM